MWHESAKLFSTFSIPSNKTNSWTNTIFNPKNCKIVVLSNRGQTIEKIIEQKKREIVRLGKKDVGELKLSRFLAYFTIFFCNIMQTQEPLRSLVYEG